MERTTTTMTMMMTMMMMMMMQGKVEEVEEVEVVETKAEAKRVMEAEEMNTTVLVEVVGAEEEGAKVEVEKVAIRLELSCLTGPSPALHLELLGYLVLVRAFYTHQPQKRPSRQ